MAVHLELDASGEKTVLMLTGHKVRTAACSQKTFKEPWEKSSEWSNYEIVSPEATWKINLFI
jgi:hypothetical protein